MHRRYQVITPHATTLLPVSVGCMHKECIQQRPMMQPHDLGPRPSGNVSGAPLLCVSQASPSVVAYAPESICWPCRCTSMWRAEVLRVSSSSDTYLEDRDKTLDGLDRCAAHGQLADTLAVRYMDVVSMSTSFINAVIRL